MSEHLHGYHGRLLRVDMTTQTSMVEPIPRETIRDYIGGRGFTGKYCYDEIPPGTDPIGPGNKLIFAVGPLSGTKMPSSGRYVVGSMSPHTGGIIRSVSGGAWGDLFKGTGHDILIIEGVAPEWVYLSITEEGVEFRDARPLLGLLTEDTEAAIQKDLGNPRARSCVIGPSGEKLVTFAAIQTERRSAARGGVGCVMGSKRLKGIAVYGKKKAEIYDKKTFDGFMKGHVKENAKGGYYAHFHELGTTGGIPLTYSLGAHPVKNFQKGTFEGIEKLFPQQILGSGLKKKNTGCWNCYMKCGSTFDVPDGPFKGEDYENPEYETMWAFGAHCLNDDFPAILAGNKICDDFGADTISTGNAVGFLMECYEKGLVSKDQLNGVELVWGDAEAMIEVARQIVNRESPAGNWVADGGVRNAAREIGGDSEDFAIQIKGLELPAYDPRGLQAHGLGYATSNMGGHHQIGYSVQELFGFPEEVDRFSAKDKGRHTVWANRFIMIYDCAVACGFPNAFTESKLDPNTFVDWLHMVTGMHEAFKSKEQLDLLYDRIYNLERAFNLRMGLDAKDDTMPKRLLQETLPDGPSAGHVWHQEELVSDYYRARGWNGDGVPTRATLELAGLGYVADDLESEGILKRE